ncbi:MAG: hypothetical protein DRN24_02415 [Thermoplasmata archaeon]|nr:MAG: hypothetical protein DRN24_02415 [Thermoplasmata archaeon]
MSNINYSIINKRIDYSFKHFSAILNNIENLVCNEFIYGGHLIALGTVGIVISSMFLFSINIQLEFLLIVYLGTLSIYSYDYYKDVDIDSSNSSPRVKHLKRYYKFRPLMISLYIGGFLFLLLYFGNLGSIIIGISLLLLGLLYTKKFKKFTGKLIGFKSYYTALSFSLLIVFTAIYCAYPLNLLLLIFSVFVFLQILLITSFCDIKDMEADKKQNLKTLPIYLGKHKFLIFLHLINFMSFILIVTTVNIKLLPSFAMFLILSNFYCFYFILKAKSTKTDIHTLTNVMVDAAYFFWPFFLFLGKIIMTIV